MPRELTTCISSISTCEPMLLNSGRREIIGKVTTKSCRWISVENDDEIIAMGSASMITPVTMVNAPTMRPISVCGTTSPYPTVVSVVMDHHIASGMEPNFSG